MKTKRICDKNLLKERDQIIWEVWERKKNYLNEEEIADIFKISLPLTKQIIKDEEVRRIIIEKNNYF